MFLLMKFMYSIKLYCCNFQGYNVAKLHGCKVILFQSCIVANLHDCKVAKAVQEDQTLRHGRNAAHISRGLIQASPTVFTRVGCLLAELQLIDLLALDQQTMTINVYLTDLYARLQIVRLQSYGCKIALLQTCIVPKLHGCKVARLKVALLQICIVVNFYCCNFQGYKVGWLQSWMVAKLPVVPYLHEKVA